MEQEITIAALFQIILRRWKMIISITILAGIIGLGIGGLLLLQSKNAPVEERVPSISPIMFVENQSLQSRWLALNQSFEETKTYYQSLSSLASLRDKAEMENSEVWLQTFEEMNTKIAAFSVSILSPLQFKMQDALEVQTQAEKEIQEQLLKQEIVAVSLQIQQAQQGIEALSRLQMIDTSGEQTDVAVSKILDSIVILPIHEQRLLELNEKLQDLQQTSIYLLKQENLQIQQDFEYAANQLHEINKNLENLTDLYAKQYGYIVQAGVGLDKNNPTKYVVNFVETYIEDRKSSSQIIACIVASMLVGLIFTCYFVACKSLKQATYLKQKFEPQTKDEIK